MFCTNCGTQFEGNFCPKCGQAAVIPAEGSETPHPVSADSHLYYDKQGDLIDLAVILGAYKERNQIISFFKRCTNYPIEEIGQIVDYMFDNVTPREYGALKAIAMRDQIESAFKRADPKGYLKELLSDDTDRSQTNDGRQTKHSRIKENQRNGIACCPKCGSTSLTANKKGFGIGKAVVGAAAAGPLGLVAGNLGAKKVWVTCLNCGHRWKM
ncbi:hypothetical protein [Intestinibacillus massiliensis]|uniref:hypothetical protein n=1 Tax=Intestinibacillus massiliensis TaxID=1871029 RepID=UPI001F3BC249|nr:hypothetical protein [Intestinibacillus massiliensis]